MDAGSATDFWRAGAVMILAIAQAVMAYWPDAKGRPETISTRSARLQLPIVPIPWAFSIWGVIFAGCIVFAVWNLLPSNLNDPLLRSVGWVAAAVFAVNVAWEFYVPRKDLGWPSVGLIVLALALLLNGLFIIQQAGPQRGLVFWCVVAPIHLFAGWITAATFVNLGSTLKRSGVVMNTTRQLVLLFAAVTLASVVANHTGSLVYAGAVAWALFGILVSNAVRDHNKVVGGIAAVSIPIVLAAAAWGEA